MTRIEYKVRETIVDYTIRDSRREDIIRGSRSNIKRESRRLYKIRTNIKQHRI